MIKNIKPFLKSFFFKFGWIIKKKYINKSYTNTPPDENFLKEISNCKGIIHMGAHRGTEAAVYDWFNKKTIWIEADPKIFLDLQINISQYINQKAYNFLLYDKDDELLNFNISSNDSASSSIFQLGKKSLETKIKTIEAIKIKTKTFDKFVEENNIDVEEYNLWIVDIQGAELLAMKGAEKSLKKCKSILIEVSKEEYYIGGTDWEELKKFLNSHNFYQTSEPITSHEDILFIKR